jgi:hypothetical protein
MPRLTHQKLLEIVVPYFIYTILLKSRSLSYKLLLYSYIYITYREVAKIKLYIINIDTSIYIYSRYNICLKYSIYALFLITPNFPLAYIVYKASLIDYKIYFSYYLYFLYYLYYSNYLYFLLPFLL